MTSISKKGTRAMVIAFTTVIILALFASLVLEVDRGILGWNIGVAVFAFAKISMAMMFTQGWKAFNRKAILGMPKVLFIIYLVLGTLLFLMFTTTTQLGPGFEQSEINFQSLIISLTGSVSTTFVMWYAGVGDWMGLGSEYEARVQFKNKGYSEQEIENSVKLLRANGVIE